ncbi:rho guanine nucleotide exchange factor 39 isoform X3 [Erpetoichthys calabaricus]|uniref:rho guanine nucleotide exchange factor 39 isoform X3 n=1 Tax=Erpetoichthys calabaricus TaxID=27687 RepID=UPI0022347310|nr:rho guanine nucleotide exchange factor 39 isoform X3 [Erpetoichthys calabaricus]
MSVYPKQYADVNIVEEQRAKWEKKRIRTTKELIETERRYFEQLELVSMYFIEILKAKGTLKPNIHDAIFSSIKLIHSANQRFLGNLEHGEFGLGFENLSSHLHFYKIYADNMENAFKVLQIQIKKNKSFARFKKLQETRPEFRGLVLEDLLTLPLQRIQQYKHFLRDLIENTSPDGSGFQQLTRRWYIREGWINVLHPKSKEAKQKMVFLFSDILLVTKPCHPLHPTNSNKFSCQAVYPLLECSVDKVFGYTRSQGGLISLTFPHEKLLLMSNDQEDINDWYRCLSSAIGQVSSTKLTASATTTDLVSCSTKVGID